MRIIKSHCDMSQNLIPTPCSHCPLVYSSGLGGLVLISTGNFPSYDYANIACYLFNGTTWSIIGNGGFPSQTPSNVYPPLRTCTSAASDGTNIILYGGKSPYISGGYYNDSWAMSSSNGTWSQSFAANTAISLAPQARAGAYMTTMSSSVEMWGGYDNHIIFTDANTMFNFTESGGWASTTVSFIPPSRINGCAVSNGTSQSIFGFGAKINGQCMNDMWSWDGSVWSSIATSGAPTTSGAPSARRSVASCYNGTDYIFFGGADSGNNPLSDSWTMNSTGTFTQLTLSNSPSARWGAQLQYLPGTGCILFGGDSGGQYPLSDTWLLPNSLATWQRLF